MLPKRADVRLDELVAGTKGLLKCVATRVRADFALVELAVAAQPAHMAVIVGELREAAVALGFLKPEEFDRYVQPNKMLAPEA